MAADAAPKAAATEANAPAAEKKPASAPAPAGNAVPQQDAAEKPAADKSAEPAVNAQGEQPPVKKEIKVDGDVPQAMLGRWLVIATLSLPGGAVSDSSLLEISHTPDGKVTFDHRTWNLPAELLDTIKAANKTHESFTPSKELLGRVSAGWSAVSPDVEGQVRGIEYWFLTPDHYTEAIKAEESARDTKAVLIISRFPKPPPGGRAPIRNDLYFFFKDLTPERASGPHTNFQLVAAFTPVPVTLQGKFTTYRIDAAGPASVAPAPAATTGGPTQKNTPG